MLQSEIHRRSSEKPPEIGDEFIYDNQAVNMLQCQVLNYWKGALLSREAISLPQILWAAPAGEVNNFFLYETQGSILARWMIIIPVRNHVINSLQIMNIKDIPPEIASFTIRCRIFKAVFSWRI